MEISRQKLSDNAIVITVYVTKQYIAVSLDNETIIIFTSGGDPLGVLQGQTKSRSLALRDDVLLNGDLDGEIHFWDLTTLIEKQTMIGHVETVRCLEFIDHQTAISASADKTLKTWDLETGECKITFSGHQEAITSLALHRDFAVSGSKDKTCRVWTVSDGCCLAILSGHTDEIYTVAFDTLALDCLRILSGSLDHDVRVWDWASETCTDVLKGHTMLVSHVHIHGDMLVTAGAEGAVRVWSLKSLTLLYALPTAHKYAVISLQAGDKYIVSAGADGLVKLWELETGNFVRELGVKAEALWYVGFSGKNVVIVLKQGPALLDVIPFE